MSPENDQKSHGWLLIALLITCGIAGALQVGKMPPVLLELQSYFLLNRIEAGFAVSIFNLVAATCGLLLGMMADRAGARRLIVAGLILSGSGAIAGSFTQNFSLFLVTRIIEGIGLTAIMLAVPTELNRIASPANKPLVMGVWGTFMPIGTGLAALLAPVFLIHHDWQSFWRMIGVLLLILAAVVAFNNRTHSRSTGVDPPPIRKGLLSVLRSPAIILIGIIFGTYSFMFSGMLSFIPSMLVEKFQFDLRSASYAAFVYALGNIAGNLSAGLLTTRGYSPQKLIIIGALFMGIGSFLIFLPSSSTIILIMIFLSPCFGGVIPATCFMLIPRLSPAPNLIGMSNGYVIQILNCGMLLSAPAVGAAIEWSGIWHSAAIVVAIGAFFCICACLILFNYVSKTIGTID